MVKDALNILRGTGRLPHSFQQKNYLAPNVTNAERLRNWALNWSLEGKKPMNKDPVNDSVYGLSAQTIRLPPRNQEEI